VFKEYEGEPRQEKDINDQDILSLKIFLSMNLHLKTLAKLTAQRFCSAAPS